MPVLSAWGASEMDSLLSMVARIIPLLVLGECALLYFVRRHRVHMKDVFNNISNGIVHRYVNLLIWTPFYFALHFAVQENALFSISIQSAWGWLGVLIFTDFIYYWFHRLLHRVPLLWTFHDSHHSSPYVHWLSAFRLNWLIGGLRAFSHLPITFLGVDPQITYFCYIVVLVFQIFIHSEYMTFPKWAESVFNSPGLHRIHHSKNEQHHDSNFGGLFIFWDKLFGTYVPPTLHPLKYGVNEHNGMGNPLFLNFGPLCLILKKAWGAPNAAQAFSILTGLEFRKFTPQTHSSKR